MGHQNARFYFTQSLEGLAEAGAWLGVENGFAQDADHRLLITNQHSRFLKEALDGRPLYMRAWIMSRGAHDAEVLQILFHAESDERAAIFLTRILCIDRAGRSIFWPKPVDRQSVDESVIARGLAPGDSPLDTADEAMRPGVISTGRGVVLPSECDAADRMRTDAIVGRVSDAMHLIMALCDENRQLAGVQHTASAAIECRLAYHRFPAAGTRFHVRSGLVAMTEKTRQIMNWMIDSATGELFATLESLEVAFDLEKRRATEWSASTRAAGAAMLVDGAPIQLVCPPATLPFANASAEVLSPLPSTKT
jgi:acyl-CoA thioester hydrolase